MADALNQRRAVAMQVIDDFIETWHAPLHAYIEEENHMPNLQVAINRLDLMINQLADPAVTAGGVAVEVLNEEEKNEVRNVAIASVMHIRSRVPLIRNYINGAYNIDNLENAIDRLETINQDLVAAAVP
ncbi:unnamed protein product [Eruca vesicaria subsp. sativa]|uniref:Uncharacterized protein n=1 Tax=Eruca vesicaria subsp. sativa TaxID=29727 RepID=A0ABC8JVC2_ERUVS|nr:unnamed protein product [Eruca vesicaria subsp. sativa]